MTSAQAEIDVLKQSLAKSPDPNQYTQMMADLAQMRSLFTMLTSQLIAKMGADLMSNTNNIQILNASCNSVHNSIDTINGSAQKNTGDIDLKTELTFVKSLNADVNVTKSQCQKALSDMKSLNSNVLHISGELSSVQNAVSNITGSSTQRHVSFEVTQYSINVTYGYNEFLKFDTLTLNTGNAYNPNTGIFLAPLDGTYLFWANVMSGNAGKFAITLRREDESITSGYTSVSLGTATINHIVQLMKGDHVGFVNTPGSGETIIYGYGYSSQ